MRINQGTIYDTEALLELLIWIKIHCNPELTFGRNLKAYTYIKKFKTNQIQFKHPLN